MSYTIILTVTLVNFFYFFSFRVLLDTNSHGGLLFFFFSPFLDLFYGSQVDAIGQDSSPLSLFFPIFFFGDGRPFSTSGPSPPPLGILPPPHTPRFPNNFPPFLLGLHARNVRPPPPPLFATASSHIVLIFFLPIFFSLEDFLWFYPLLPPFVLNVNAQYYFFLRMA